MTAPRRAQASGLVVPRGGLNYQIEHHLFPSMPRPHLRLAQSMVKARCRDLGIPYAETDLVDSYRQALRHMWENRCVPTYEEPTPCATPDAVAAHIGWCA